MQRRDEELIGTRFCIQSIGPCLIRMYVHVFYDTTNLGKNKSQRKIRPLYSAFEFCTLI